MTENRTDRQVLEASMEVLNTAIDALLHGEPTLKNGVYDREGWHDVIEEAMDQVDVIREQLNT